MVTSERRRSLVALSEFSAQGTSVLSAIGTVTDSIRFKGFADASTPGSSHGGIIQINTIGTNDSTVMSYISMDKMGDKDYYSGDQAAIELEMVAASAVPDAIYPFAIEGQTLGVSPMIRAIVNDIQKGVSIPLIAYRFHRSIAELLATVCCREREQSGLNVVALSGGVFQNRLLLEQLMLCLDAMSFQVYINRRVPPNDGGLSLGQLAVAAARLQKR